LQNRWYTSTCSKTTWRLWTQSAPDSAFKAGSFFLKC
jgi:hypothetical protein